MGAVCPLLWRQFCLGVFECAGFFFCGEPCVVLDFQAGQGVTDPALIRAQTGPRVLPGEVALAQTFACVQAVAQRRGVVRPGGLSACPGPRGSPRSVPPGQRPGGQIGAKVFAHKLAEPELELLGCGGVARVQQHGFDLVAQVRGEEGVGCGVWVHRQTGRRSGTPPRARCGGRASQRASATWQARRRVGPPRQPKNDQRCGQRGAPPATAEMRARQGEGGVMRACPSQTRFLQTVGVLAVQRDRVCREPVS